MTDQQQLQEALRDLLGPLEGLWYFTKSGTRGVMDAEKARRAQRAPSTWLPDLKSPANWGVWISALAQQFGYASMELQWDQEAIVQVGDGSACGPPAWAMLTAVCQLQLVKPGCEAEPMAPSVLDWWSEQKAREERAAVMTEDRAFWKRVEKAAQEVAKWPEWKRRAVDRQLHVEPVDTDDDARFSWWPPAPLAQEDE